MGAAPNERGSGLKPRGSGVRSGFATPARPQQPPDTPGITSTPGITRRSLRCRSRNRHSRNPGRARAAQTDRHGRRLFSSSSSSSSSSGTRVMSAVRSQPTLRRRHPNLRVPPAAPGAGWVLGGSGVAAGGSPPGAPPAQPHAQGSVSAESGSCRRLKTTRGQSPELGRRQEPPRPSGGTQHPAPHRPHPRGPPEQGPQTMGRPSTQALTASVQPDVGAGYRGRSTGPLPCPCPPAQMGSGGPSIPPQPSCQPGQGGEGLSALATVPISVISAGWGQGRPAAAGQRCPPMRAPGQCHRGHCGITVGTGAVSQWALGQHRGGH